MFLLGLGELCQLALRRCLQPDVLLRRGVGSAVGRFRESVSWDVDVVAVSGPVMGVLLCSVHRELQRPRGG